jgi:hypothetical protein
VREKHRLAQASEQLAAVTRQIDDLVEVRSSIEQVIASLKTEGFQQKPGQPDRLGQGEGGHQ